MGEYVRSYVKTDEKPTGSFTEFVCDLEPRLRRALCSALGRDAGQEATAEALAYGWEHWDRVREMTNPSGYLYRVGRNGVRHRRRKSGLLPALPEGKLPWIEPKLPGALGRLSESQRVSVMLVHGFGWTYVEVGEYLDVSKSTVQTHLERGMARLRKELRTDI